MAVTELGTTPSRRTFEDFHAHRAGDALRYATAIVGQREAEDACQEAWLRIWRSWGRSDPDRLDAWAFRIVRNCALDRGRSQSRIRSTEPLGEIDPPAPSGVEDVVMPRIEAEGALRLLGQLSVPLRAAVALLVAVAAPPGGLPVTHVENADEAAVAPAAPPEFNAPETPEVTAPTAPANARAGHGTAASAAGHNRGPAAATPPGAEAPPAPTGNGGAP